MWLIVLLTCTCSAGSILWDVLNHFHQMHRFFILRHPSVQCLRLLISFQVDEIYHDESLGTNINIVLVRMIMVGYRQVSFQIVVIFYMWKYILKLLLKQRYLVQDWVWNQTYFQWFKLTLYMITVLLLQEVIQYILHFV